MTDRAVDFSLEIARSGNTAVIRCHGKLVAGVDNVLYRDVKQLIAGMQAHCAGLDGPHSNGQHGPRRTGSVVRLCAFCGLQSGARQSEQAGPDAAEDCQFAIGFLHGLRIQHQDGLIRHAAE